MNAQRLKELARWLMRRIPPPDPPRPWSEISIVLSTDDELQALNREYFARDRSTDVISFSYDPLPGEAPGASGEVVLNVPLAFREGARRGDPARELALYLAHGLDHLGGAEDDTPARRARMLDRENGWLDAAAREGLLENLLPEREPPAS